MAIQTLFHIKSTLILLFDGNNIPEKAAEILSEGIFCVIRELYPRESQIRFFKRLGELIHGKDEIT
jgi:hypothetical protein